MTFDTGTWWLITIILTALLGCIGALVSRSIFKSLDEHSSDIKEVRENYTTRKDHKTDIDAVRREMKEVRSEMRTEIQTLSEDIKEVKETCLRKDVCTGALTTGCAMPARSSPMKSRFQGQSFARRSTICRRADILRCGP